MKNFQKTITASKRPPGCPHVNSNMVVQLPVQNGREEIYFSEDWKLAAEAEMKILLSLPKVVILSENGEGHLLRSE